MVSIFRRWLAIAALQALAAGFAGTVVHAQVETVPTAHPVYRFLKRMEVKGMIDRYFDAVLPLSRSGVAALLSEVESGKGSLTSVEIERLQDFRSEFRCELSGNISGVHSVIDPGIEGVSEGVGGMFSGAEQYLYAFRDSTASLFVNGLLAIDTRAIWGDALGRDGATFLQFGGRLRGTLLGSLGYYLQGTNAQFWGSRALLERDPSISQSYALRTPDARNFDFVDGYLRYETQPVSVQVGRERLLWGTGYDQQMVLSDNPRVFDFIRADVQYRSLKYTFVHAWLLGRHSSLTFSLPSDTSAVFVEPVVADKYFAGHRLEFSFGSVVDVGAQEMVIYSNRAPDLAYLNPLTVIESAQRSRGERDNVMWAFDLQTRFLRGIQVTGTVLFDDLHLAQFFDDFWYNRYGYQAGVFIADPFSLGNLSVTAEYTRIEPYVFSHDRSRDNDYGSLGAILGPRIGPNADSWYVRAEFSPWWNLRFMASVQYTRKGENEVDSTGHLVRNVGGDIMQPHRDSDPLMRTFLDGILVTSLSVHVRAEWEVVNQVWVEGEYLGTSESRPEPSGRTVDHVVRVTFRTEL